MSSVKIDGEGKTHARQAFLAVVITSQKTWGIIEGHPPGNPAPLRPARPVRRRSGEARGHRQDHHRPQPRYSRDRGRPPQTSMELASSWPRAGTLASSRSSTETVIIAPRPQPRRRRWWSTGTRKNSALRVGPGGAVTASPLQRARQQPRLVHVHPGGEPNHRDSPLRPLRRSSTTLHQMGSNAARIFATVDPLGPGVDPSLIAATNTIGTYIAAPYSLWSKVRWR